MIADEVVAPFELALLDDEVKVVDERHWRLVPGKMRGRDTTRGDR